MIIILDVRSTWYSPGRILEVLSKAHERSLGHKGLLGLAQQQRLDRVAHILVGYCRKGPVEPLTVG